MKKSHTSHTRRAFWTTWPKIVQLFARTFSIRSRWVFVWMSKIKTLLGHKPKWIPLDVMTWILNTLQSDCVHIFGTELEKMKTKKQKKKPVIDVGIATSITYTTSDKILRFAMCLSFALGFFLNFGCQFRFSARFHPKQNKVRDAIDCVGLLYND